MAKSAFQRMLAQINNLKFKILNTVAPATSWFALFYYNQFWLSRLSKKIVGKWESQTRKHEKIVERWRGIHQPENWWKAVMLAAGIIFVPQLLAVLWFISPLSPIPTRYGWHNSGLSSALSTSWQVTAGLIGIAFVIVIFIIEYANRGKYEQRALPIFFSETWMLFTASFGLLVILSTGLTSLLLSYRFRNDLLSSLYFYQWILFITNISLIIKIFISTIRILSRSYFLSKVKEANHRTASRVVEMELIDRVASARSFEIFKSLGITFPFFEPDPSHDKVTVSLKGLTRQIQKVTDINLKLVDLAFVHAKQIMPALKESDFIFYAKLDHRLAYEKPGVALINPALNYPFVTAYLERSVQVNDSSRGDKSRLTEELTLNRDMILNAIQNQESETVEYLLDHYYNLIEDFLTATEAYGVRFTQESALKEMTLFSDWKLISMIIDQYRSLVPSFLGIVDFEMVKHFLRFPINLMNLAILYRDHLIYQQFAGLLVLILFRAQNIQNPQQKERINESILHLLIDHRRFSLAPRLNKSPLSKQSLDEYKGYFKDLLVTWNRLLKVALDNRSEAQFSNFAHETGQLVREFYPDMDDLQLEIIGSSINQTSDAIQRAALSEGYQLNKAALQNKLELIKFVHRMFLGLGGWITHLVEKDRITQDDYFNLIPSVHASFVDFEDLYQAYTSDLGEEKEENLFNWISWETSERPSIYGEVSSGTFTYNSWLEKYFLVRSIEIIRYDEKPFPSVTPSFRSEGIYESIEKTANEIRKDARWQEIFRRAGISHINERIDALIEILRKAKTQQQLNEEQEIINSPLDETLVASFKSEVINNWKKYAIIRGLVLRLGRYREIYNEEWNKNSPWYGFNKYAPKEAFIKQNRITYVGWSESYGRGLANIENNTLAAQFAIENGIKSNRDHFAEIIAENIAEMIDLGLSPIIFFNGEETYKEFRKSNRFTPAWRAQNNPLRDITITGLFESIPVINIHGLPHNIICLVDIYQFGILTQYKPDESTPVQIRVDVLSQERAQEIVDSQPDIWMKDPDTDQVLDPDARFQKALQHVLLQISEYCQFEEVNIKAVRSISFEMGGADPKAQKAQDNQEGDK